jgi:hypothetical protein
MHCRLESIRTVARNGVTNLDLAYDAIGNITSKTSATETAENIGTCNYTTATVRRMYTQTIHSSGLMNLDNGRKKRQIEDWSENAFALWF